MFETVQLQPLFSEPPAFYCLFQFCFKAVSFPPVRLCPLSDLFSDCVSRVMEYSLDGHNASLSAIRTVRVLRPLRAINRVPSKSAGRLSEGRVFQLSLSFLYFLLCVDTLALLVTVNWRLNIYRKNEYSVELK